MPIRRPTIDQLLDADAEHACEGFGTENVCVKIAAIAGLPSRFGDFQVVGYWNNRDESDHAAFVHGDPCGAENVLVRFTPSV